MLPFFALKKHIKMSGKKHRKRREKKHGRKREKTMKNA